MKQTFLLLTLFLSLKCFAQKKYTASNGITYHVKDTVKLGLGSGPNGSFNYLQLAGWSAVISGEYSNIGKGYANTAVVIKSIKKSKLKGVVVTYFIVGGGNISNYMLQIEPAIQTCEVIPCPNTKVEVINSQSNDKFDQLKKLKSLLDSGAITQDEYNQQKKKLLDQ
jgi:hypothetical protein